MRRLLSIFFALLYHPLAWAYDGIAWLVSIGHWQDWAKSILPMIPPGPVLELGFGTGHLQGEIKKQNPSCYGIDESWPMCQLAMRKNKEIKVVRALAQSLPFPSSCFDALVATFPPPFIFQPETAQEIKRLLLPGGKLVALLAARPLRKDPVSGLIRLLFRVTGETPDPHLDFDRLLAPYVEAGFQVDLSWVERDQAALFILGCAKMKESVEV